jgi:hypothetical protein
MAHFICTARPDEVSHEDNFAAFITYDIFERFTNGFEYQRLLRGTCGSNTDFSMRVHKFFFNSTFLPQFQHQIEVHS